MSRPADRRWPALVGLGVAAYAALFTYLSFRKQDDFEYGRFDLGNMTQAVWNTAHGRVLEMSDAFGRSLVRLGVHVDPILAAFAPLYRAWPDPKLLLAGQAAFVAAGAWPAYRLARLELAGLAPDWAPAALAGAYLLYPPLQWATLDEFHPVTLAPTLLLFAILLLRERRYRPFALAAVGAILCKEEVGLLVAMLGLYAAFVWGDRRAGLLSAAAGAGWSVFAFAVVIPHYSPSGAGPFADRYAAVGGGPGGILARSLTDPLRVLGEGTSGRDLGYVAGQLAPLLALPLLAPAALACALPELAANLLSSQQAQSSWRFHYVAGQVPFLWWAAVLGVRRVLKKARDRARLAQALNGAVEGSEQERAGPLRLVRALPAAPVLACLVAGYLMGPLPWWSHLPGGSETRAGAYSPDNHDRAVARVLASLPAGVAISVTNRMGARAATAERRSVALFPALGRARFVLADRRNPAYGVRNGSGSPGARHPVGREQRAALAALVAAGWRPFYESGGAVVLVRPPGASTRHATSPR